MDIVIFSCVGSVLGPGLVDDGTGILPELGISGSDKPSQHRRETALGMEKGWEITIDQFRSIIFHIYICFQY